MAGMAIANKLGNRSNDDIKDVFEEDSSRVGKELVRIKEAEVTSEADTARVQLELNNQSPTIQSEGEKFLRLKEEKESLEHLITKYLVKLAEAQEQTLKAIECKENNIQILKICKKKVYLMSCLIAQLRVVKSCEELSESAQDLVLRLKNGHKWLPNGKKMRFSTSD